MRIDQYENLLEALLEDLDQVRIDYEAGRLNGEHADLQEREIYDQMLMLEIEWQESQYS